MVCMAVLLASFTGCYSAKKDGPSTASSAQTAQLGSGSGTEESVEIRTYVLPEENVRADSIYVPSPSTGGFWTWAVFTSKTIQAYDPVTRTTYYPAIRRAASTMMPPVRLISEIFPRWQSIGAISML